MFQFLIFTVFLSLVNGAKIIGIFMTPSYSHQIVFQPIWKELSLQGHDVTIVTPNPLKDPTLVNLTEIDISEISYGAWNNEKIMKLGLQEHGFMEELEELTQIYTTLSHAQLSHPIFQNLIHNSSNVKYDLFLVEFLWPVMYPFKDVFNCPMVGIASMPTLSSAYKIFGMERHPVVDPDLIMHFATDLTFIERITSALTGFLFEIGDRFDFTPKIFGATQKYFGENVRNTREIAREISLVLINSNFAIQNIKPTVPQYVEISGIHIKPPKPLPKNLKDFLDSSTEGVIYFSLGSNVKSSLLPEDKLQTFLEAFKDLPYKILWKYETDNPPKIPKNVFIRKWLPQQDLLLHPNIKLFITQGGIQSLDEALNAKVPILLIPMFGDQRFNTDMMVKKGAGLRLNFHDFTSEEMRAKILELINDRKYKETVTKLSSIAFDQPMTALEKATWHINYVIRHKGAAHLNYKAKNMPWYQVNLIDVHGFLLLMLLVTIMTPLMICSCIKRAMDKRKEKKERKM